MLESRKLRTNHTNNPSKVKFRKIELYDVFTRIKNNFSTKLRGLNRRNINNTKFRPKSTGFSKKRRSVSEWASAPK